MTLDDAAAAATAADDALAAATQMREHAEAEAAARRERLQAIEGSGLTASEIRELADTVRLSDPADIEDAREAEARAHLAATQALLVVRRLDLPAATQARDAAEQKLRAAQKEFQAARSRLLAAHGSDVAAQLADERRTLERLEQTHAANRQRRLGELTNTRGADAPTRTVLDIAPRAQYSTS